MTTDFNPVRYVRKPFYVDAVKVTTANIDAIAKWVEGEQKTDEDGMIYVQVRVNRPMNEKQTRAYVGNWVLYGGTGFKVYTNKAFQGCFVEETATQGEKAVEAPAKAMPGAIEATTVFSAAN